MGENRSAVNEENRDFTADGRINKLDHVITFKMLVKYHLQLSKQQHLDKDKEPTSTHDKMAKNSGRKKQDTSPVDNARDYRENEYGKKIHEEKSDDNGRERRCD